MGLRPITNPNDAVDVIDKIIVIQVFKKDQNPDDLVSESLRKYVGRLRSYWITKNLLCFAIDGMPYIYIDRHKEYHELWVLKLSRNPILKNSRGDNSQKGSTDE